MEIQKTLHFFMVFPVAGNDFMIITQSRVFGNGFVNVENISGKIIGAVGFEKISFSSMGSFS